MSDFFSGIQNARFPDVVMNQGPLPPMTGLPAPLHDTADARINYNSGLLEGISPYAYGEPGYQSSQVSYVNHPHRIQKIIPELRLPRGLFMTTDDFPISHPVDDSDISFVLRLDRSSTVCTLLKNASIHRYKLGTAIDPFINLATLNYLLAGMQLCVENYDTCDPNLWKNLLHDLDKERFNDDRWSRSPHLSFLDIIFIVRELITPFGVVRGSEKQGGQHETGLAPVQWPVNFIATMVVDGFERNVLNYWHNKDVDAGDDLVLRLKPMPVPDGYVLNHYYKSVARQDFRSLRNRNGNLVQVVNDNTCVWQLVPDIMDLKARDEFTAQKQMPNDYLGIPNPYHWQEWGYWHIGRTQIKANKCAVQGDYHNDDMAMNLRLGHLEMTFEPCWQKVPGLPVAQYQMFKEDAVARRAQLEPSALRSAWDPLQAQSSSFLDSLPELPRAPPAVPLFPTMQAAPAVAPQAPHAPPAFPSFMFHPVPIVQPVLPVLPENAPVSPPPVVLPEPVVVAEKSAAGGGGGNSILKKRGPEETTSAGAAPKKTSTPASASTKKATSFSSEVKKT